jgi:hypothetical protein
MIAVILLRASTREEAPAPARSMLVEGRIDVAGNPLRVADKLPSGVRLSVAPRARFEVGNVRVVTGAASQLTIGPELERPEIALDDGTLALLVDPLSSANAVAVRTPLAKLTTIGGEFRIRASGRQTVLEVERGEVRVDPVDGTPASVLRAGGRTIVTPRTEQVVHEPAPPPAAELERKPPRAVERSAPNPPVAAAPSEPIRPAPPAPTPEPAAARELTPPIEIPPRSGLTGPGRAKPAHPPSLGSASLRASLAVPESEQMSQADTLRRDGELRAALAVYLDVAERSGGFAEEATLRAAKISLALGDPDHAVALLDGAAKRWTKGALRPERVALRVRIEREVGDLETARTILEAAQDCESSVPLLEERLELGRAFKKRDPRAARIVLTPLLRPEVVEAVRKQAIDLVRSL